MWAGKAGFAIVVFAAVCGATPAYAGFEQDYALAIKALQDNRVADAQAALERAYEDQSNPVDKVYVEGNWQPYIPLHYLGLIAAARGDCAAASSQWSSQANRRMISRYSLVYQQEQDALAKCKASKPQTASSATETTSTPQDAPKLAEAGNAPGQTTPAPTQKPGPPDALKQALQHYISGRYAEAARLDPTALNEPRAKFHAYVIRAAARFMLASIGAEPGSLDLARADAHAARAIDPRASLDTATFSPRFIAFYGGVP